MGYRIEITADDIETIAWIGNRYEWSSWAHSTLETGINDLAEHEAWELIDAMAADIDGGHSPLPLLNPHCMLYDKLIALWQSIV